MSPSLARKPAPACELHVRGSNRLLSMLQNSGEARTLRRLEQLHLKRRDSLYRPDVPITHAYFPLTGVASLVIDMEDGPSIEVGTMGNEGMVGMPLVLGSDRSSTHAYVQIEGEFMRMTVAEFETELARNAVFADVTRRYAQGFFAQVAQSTACLRFHPVEQRLCRWILTCHDRVGQDRVELTQEFLAVMLGVQRPSVTLAATALQKAGLIRYRRGVIDVVDRAALETTACECYGIVRKEFERLLC
jgi:CRP-like cAMP-binding protein